MNDFSLVSLWDVNVKIPCMLYLSLNAFTSLYHFHFSPFSPF